MTIVKIRNSKFIGNIWNMLCHLNAILIRLNFYFFYQVFQRDDLQDNLWFCQSVMKPVETVVSKKRKSMREGNNDEIDNFEMEIIDKGVLYKALEFPGNVLDGNKTWRTLYEVIGDEYFKQSDIGFTKYFILNAKQNIMFLILSLLMSKIIRQIFLEHGSFSHIVRIKRTIIGELEMDSRNKNKTKISIFKFVGRSVRSKKYFALEYS